MVDYKILGRKRRDEQIKLFANSLSSAANALLLGAVILPGTTAAHNLPTLYWIAISLICFLFALAMPHFLSLES